MTAVFITACGIRHRDATVFRHLALFRAALCLVSIIAITACSTPRPVDNQSATPTTTTFIIVRHAEKATDDKKDPSLSEAGLMRADRLAARLVDEPLVAAYATDYRRTRQTAAPAAEAHEIVVSVYDAQLPATTLVSQLRKAHTHGTVLVVGHSNTVPEIVAALSGTIVPQMADDEFDRLYRIDLKADGETTLFQDRY
jgi:broad specificity phosphatase PhoE